MKSTLNLVIFLSCMGAVACLGCSSKPSPEEAESKIRADIAAESEGRIELTLFQKTNARQGESRGIKFYELEFSAEATVVQDCKVLTDATGALFDKTFKTRIAPSQNGAINSVTDYLDESSKYPGLIVKVGDKFTFTGMLTFEETENGWRATRLDKHEGQLVFAPRTSDVPPLIARRGVMQFYYYDVTTGEQFIDEGDAIPPVVRANGNKAYKAYVFTCGSCSNASERFVGYYEGFTDKYKAKRQAAIDAAKSSKPGGGIPDTAMYMEEGLSEGRMLSVDGKTWVTSDSPEGIEINITLSKACDKKGGQLKPCYPGRE